LRKKSKAQRRAQTAKATTAATAARRARRLVDPGTILSDEELRSLPLEDALYRLAYGGVQDSDLLKKFRITHEQLEEHQDLLELARANMRLDLQLTLAKKMRAGNVSVMRLLLSAWIIDAPGDFSWAPRFRAKLLKLIADGKRS
jgi:hypothetical protein